MRYDINPHTPRRAYRLPKANIARNRVYRKSRRDLYRGALAVQACLQYRGDDPCAEQKVDRDQREGEEREKDGTEPGEEVTVGVKQV